MKSIAIECHQREFIYRDEFGPRLWRRHEYLLIHENGAIEFVSQHHLNNAYIPIVSAYPNIRLYQKNIDVYVWEMKQMKFIAQQKTYQAIGDRGSFLIQDTTSPYHQYVFSRSDVENYLEDKDEEELGSTPLSSSMFPFQSPPPHNLSSDIPSLSRNTSYQSEDCSKTPSQCENILNPVFPNSMQPLSHDHPHLLERLFEPIVLSLQNSLPLTSSVADSYSWNDQHFSFIGIVIKSHHISLEFQDHSYTSQNQRYRGKAGDIAVFNTAGYFLAIFSMTEYQSMFPKSFIFGEKEDSIYLVLEIDRPLLAQQISTPFSATWDGTREFGKPGDYLVQFDLPSSTSPHYSITSPHELELTEPNGNRNGADEGRNGMQHFLLPSSLYQIIMTQSEVDLLLFRSSSMP
jgi:hypothetical protein